MAYPRFFSARATAGTAGTVNTIVSLALSVSYFTRGNLDAGIFCLDWMLLGICLATCYYKEQEDKRYRRFLKSDVAAPILSKPDKYEAIGEIPESKNDEDLESIDISITVPEMKR